MLSPERMQEMCSCGHRSGQHNGDEVCMEMIHPIDTPSYRCSCDKFKLDNFWYIENKRKP